MAGTVKTSSNRGFTLVELLVTLAMSAMLVAAMYALFGNQQKLYATEEQVIQMQQNARVGMNMIARDVRMAGFFGCASAVNATVTVRNHSSNFLDSFAPVNGLDNVTGGTGNPFGAKAGTDVLAVSYSDSENQYPIAHPYMTELNSTSADVHLADATGLVKGDIAVISDCTHTSIFQITGITNSVVSSGRSLGHSKGQQNPSPGNSQKDLEHEYGPGSTVFKIAQKYYWLNDKNELIVAKGRYDDGSGTWSPTNNEVVVAENIQNLQFVYGVDTDTDGRPDQWQDATDVSNSSNWDKVVAVRIYILARTARQEKDYVNRHSYTVSDSNGAVTLGPFNDAYHRYFLERSEAIRNRWSG